jgi:hypothetical protein
MTSMDFYITHEVGNFKFNEFAKYEFLKDPKRFTQDIVLKCTCNYLELPYDPSRYMRFTTHEDSEDFDETFKKTYKEFQRRLIAEFYTECVFTDEEVFWRNKSMPSDRTLPVIFSELYKYKTQIERLQERVDFLENKKVDKGHYSNVIKRYWRRYVLIKRVREICKMRELMNKFSLISIP